MTTIPTIVVTPSAAAEAYARVSRSTAGATPGEAGGDFGATLQQALDQAVQTGHTADDQATKAISGTGNLTDVVVAVSHAELTLQTVTAIRDRMVQAYQDVIKMPI